MTSTHPRPPASDVAAELLTRLEDRLPAIGARLVERYRREIVDYCALGEQTLEGDVTRSALANLEELVADLRAGTVIDSVRLERFRRSAVRRAHQGVSFRGLLHAYRLWGQVVWEELLAAASPTDPEEREAALSMAGPIMIHVDAVSAAVAEAYMDEVAGVSSDRDAIGRDLLELLLAGRAITDDARRQLAGFAFDSRDANVVVVARHIDPAAVARTELRAVLARTRERLAPEAGPLLVGLREGEVVAIYPVADTDAARTVDQQAQHLAGELPEFVVGIGRGHLGLPGIASSYHDAHEAIQIALTVGVRGRAVAFADVLLDHILRKNPDSAELLEETIAPILRYDAGKKADLTLTLRTYFESGFNLTRSAAALHVHANTVVYRLQRIKQITGRDPSDPDDLLLLVLAIKLLEVGRAYEPR